MNLFLVVIEGGDLLKRVYRYSEFTLIFSESCKQLKKRNVLNVTFMDNKTYKVLLTT